MAWLRPVYNKTADSFENISDIKRIAGNIDYIIRAIKGNQGVVIPVAEVVFQRIKRMETITANDFVYQSDFVDICEVIDYIIDLFASIRPTPVLSLPENLRSKIDYQTMNFPTDWRL